ncbi:MAG: hypothetical protein WBV66_13710 [Pseudolabrys sp.]|jgi:hypothetical protein
MDRLYSRNILWALGCEFIEPIDHLGIAAIGAPKEPKVIDFKEARSKLMHRARLPFASVIHGQQSGYRVRAMGAYRMARDDLGAVLEANKSCRV